MKTLRFRITLSTLLVGIFLLGVSATPIHAAVSLVADYQLQNIKTSSVGSAPALTDLGTTTFAQDTVDGNGCTVLTWATDNGISVTPTTGTILSDAYTIVLLFRLDTTSGYRKLVDFKNGTSDSGLYVLSSNLRLYPVASGTGAPITDGTYVQVALTRDSSKNVIGYVNGVEQFNFSDTSDYGLIDTANTLRFFIDDNSTGGEESAGAAARIRLYDGPLNAAQVAALDRAESTCSGAGMVTVDDDSPEIAYGSWDGVSDGVASGGAYRMSSDTTGKASLKFNGTSVKYSFIKGAGMGKVDVYIDNLKNKTICLYNATTVSANKTIKNLTDAKHKIEIRPTGMACGGGTAVSLDKFVVGATTYEESGNKVVLDGWTGAANALGLEGAIHKIKKSASASMDFSGTQVQVLTLGNYGTIIVKIDNVTVDTFTPPSADVAYGKLYTGLSAGAHTIQVLRSSGTIALDGFRVPE